MAVIAWTDEARQWLEDIAADNPHAAARIAQEISTSSASFMARSISRSINFENAQKVAAAIHEFFGSAIAEAKLYSDFLIGKNWLDAVS